MRVVGSNRGKWVEWGIGMGARVKEKNRKVGQEIKEIGNRGIVVDIVLANLE
jgi:hypothetical protein